MFSIDSQKGCFGFRHMKSDDRLLCLRIDSLKIRFIRADLLMSYKLLYGHLDISRYSADIALSKLPMRGQ